MKELEKHFDYKKEEPRIYEAWEKSGNFNPDKQENVKKNKNPFTILLPLPNANDAMHMGHGLFTVEDIMSRYHRMLGEPALWLPGADHAGIETQFVLEKELNKKGKSRFDYDRETLYKMVSDFVDKNRAINKDQFKILGFSLDMSRYTYSMEDRIVKTILQTFKKLHEDNLIYRGNKLVNFCTKCGTTFSDLEVNHKEEEGELYYLGYGSIAIATTRPETIFADVAVAVNPKSKKYKKLIGKYATIPLINKKIPIISDDLVKIDFGTGALKITPAHDEVDFEIGRKHKLESISVINRFGRINYPSLREVHGLKTNPAREKTLELLKKSQKLIKIEKIKHSVDRCYKCNNIIEPMLLAQWFIKMKSLAKPAIEAVKGGKTKIVPKKRFEKMYFDWLANIHDWPISRQVVWGPRIPIWYCLDCNPDITLTFINKAKEKITGTYQELKDRYKFSEIKTGLQSFIAGENPIYSLEDQPCANCKSKNILQETDTLDTWFLSGQWPLTTLGFKHNTPKKKQSIDFRRFYPTSVLDTLWDIIFFWVARMMMFGLYVAKEVPFRVIHLHARVVDKHGQKMSKSKGNVINATETVKNYGADALRFALAVGVAPASDICVSEEKIRGARNFVTKIWNASRFVLSVLSTRTHADNDADSRGKNQDLDPNTRPALTKYDEEELKKLNDIIKLVTKNIDNFKFGQAAEEIYNYFWHHFCDKVIEKCKDRIYKPANPEDKKSAQYLLYTILKNSLKLLHPFMPFVTEAVWQKLPKTKGDRKFIMISQWPTLAERGKS